MWYFTWVLHHIIDSRVSQMHSLKRKTPSVLGTGVMMRAVYMVTALWVPEIRNIWKQALFLLTFIEGSSSTGSSNFSLCHVHVRVHVHVHVQEHARLASSGANAGDPQVLRAVALVSFQKMNADRRLPDHLWGWLRLFRPTMYKNNGNVFWDTL